MLSSVNSFGGLSSAELMTLFGAKPSSSLGSTSANSDQSELTSISGSTANDPTKTIQAIVAQAQIDTSQADGSSSILSASVIVSTPGALQQIDDAVSLVNRTVVAQTNLVTNYVSATAADAVNVTISNGAVSTTAVQGAAFPNGLPSLTSIQQALSELKSEDQSTGWNGQEATPESTASEVDNSWWNSVGDGNNFTLVQIPSNASTAPSGNIITFSSGDTNWALVLPQQTVSVTASDTQSAG